MQNYVKKILLHFDKETYGEAKKLRNKLVIEIKNAINSSNEHFALPISPKKSGKIKIMGISSNSDGLRLKLFIDNKEISITEYDTHGNER